MAFSKTPRVLITDELSRPGVPGPCDYDPNDASEKRIKGFSIREEDVKKERRQSSGRDPWTDYRGHHIRLKHLVQVGTH